MSNTGSYRIWTADRDGNPIDLPDDVDKNKNPFPIPSNSAAVDIYFGLDEKSPQPPPKDQGELQEEIARVLGIIRRLYISQNNALDNKFRRYYIRLFRLAQLGLEGQNASTELAKTALASVIKDLVDDEAGRVKNGHLVTLGHAVMILGVPFLLCYLVLTLAPVSKMEPWLTDLGIIRKTAANFMLVWIGCFVGVWLSYGIRTTTISLEDLISANPDRLLPHIRLIFAGTLTMVLSLLFVLGIIEVKIGGFVVTEISDNPTLSFVLGILCGISEASLPDVASRRAASFAGSIK